MNDKPQSLREILDIAKKNGYVSIPSYYNQPSWRRIIDEVERCTGLPVNIAEVIEYVKAIPYDIRSFLSDVILGIELGFTGASIFEIYESVCCFTGYSVDLRKAIDYLLSRERLHSLDTELEKLPLTSEDVLSDFMQLTKELDRVTYRFDGREWSRFRNHVREKLKGKKTGTIPKKGGRKQKNRYT